MKSLSLLNLWLVYYYKILHLIFPNSCIVSSAWLYVLYLSYRYYYIFYNICNSVGTKEMAVKYLLIDKHDLIFQMFLLTINLLGYWRIYSVRTCPACPFLQLFNLSPKPRTEITCGEKNKAYVKITFWVSSIFSHYVE